MVKNFRGSDAINSNLEKQKEKTVTFAFRTSQKIAGMIRSYAYYENKSVRAVMEEIITEKLNGVDLPKRKDEEEN